jgi:hypothetical protein
MDPQSPLQRELNQERKPNEVLVRIYFVLYTMHTVHSHGTVCIPMGSVYESLRGLSK